MTTPQPPDTHHGDSHTSQSEQQTQTPTPSWQPMAESNLQDKHDTGAADQAVGLTFFQRHFTKPIDPEPDKQHAKDNRAFSFRSRGALATACIMILILLGVVGAAVGVTLTRSHQRYKSTPDHPSLVRMVLDDNFPDPALWKDGKTWYAFATNNAAGILQRPDNASSYEYGVSNIQVATSTNFLNWTLLNSTHDPLPDTGLWAVQGRDNRTHSPIPRANVWAPSVARQPSKDGKYIMYYTAARNRLAREDLKDDKQKGADESAFLPRHPAPHCIGAATASSPMGPYSPLPTPIACPIAQGGAIDPAAFTDHDHTPYLLYKVDGNNIGHGGECGNTVRPRIPTPIMLQKLSASGLEPIDSPIAILNRTASDGPLVEAPDLIRSHEGIYFLFFSSGCTRAPSYDLKYATATDIRGPYTRAERPLLQTGDWGLHAPGSAGLFADGEGRWNIVFHARVAAEQGRVRAMFVGRVEVEGRRARFVGGVGLEGRGGGKFEG